MDRRVRAGIIGFALDRSTKLAGHGRSKNINKLVLSPDHGDDVLGNVLLVGVSIRLENGLHHLLNDIDIQLEPSIRHQIPNL